MKYPLFGYMALLVTMFTASGASCRHLARQSDPAAPIVFVGPPTMDDVIYAVNTNSAVVRQLSTENATLTTAGAPSLRATISLERPRNFRLRAKLIGQELDVGSNAELFWIWTKSDPERAVYYAYHEQFSANAATQGIPIGPDWLIEAMGLVQLDPTGVHEGPTLRPDQNVEIRSRLDRNGTPYSRVLVIDSKRGWILEQHLWDAAGRNLATSRCSNHSFYQENGVSLPHRIQIELPTMQLSFQIDVSQYRVNQLYGDPEELWRPKFEGYRMVNIADQPMPGAMAPSPYGAQRPVASPNDWRTSYRPRYRGLAEDVNR